MTLNNDNNFDRNSGPSLVDNNQAPEIISVGASDRLLLSVSLFGFGVMAYLVYSIVWSKVKTAREFYNGEDEQDRNKYSSFEERLAQADVSTLTRTQRRARARFIMKQQRRVAPFDAVAAADMVEGEDGRDDPQRRQQQPQEEEQPDELQVPPFEEDHPHTTSHLRHLSRKERQKAAKQIELHERRLLEEDRRKEQEEAQKEAWRKKKVKEQQLALQVEEQRKKRHAQCVAQEQAAFQSWRIFLPQPTAATIHEAPTKNCITVKEWEQELAINRIVTIDSLAHRFRVSREEVRIRIEELINEGRIFGILESDCFIYLSRQDLAKLASFVKLQDKFDLDVIRSEIERLYIPDSVNSSVEETN